MVITCRLAILHKFSAPRNGKNRNLDSYFYGRCLKMLLITSTECQSNVRSQAFSNGYDSDCGPTLKEDSHTHLQKSKVKTHPW